MENLFQSQTLNSPFVGSDSSATNAATISQDQTMAWVEQLLSKLRNPDLRENALLDLSMRKGLLGDLAPVLWYSFGTIAALLQEIISIYPVLSPPTLTQQASDRVCNALAVLQCMAVDLNIRTLFIKAHIPLYMYPFLNTTTQTRPFDNLRLISLGVIGALVKVDNDTEMINFLLTSEIVPLCLRSMEMGGELSKAVATYIIQKILLDDAGLRYICCSADRFYAVHRVLARMVQSLAERPSKRLLIYIIRCYLRLSNNARGCSALQKSLPDMLQNGTFSEYLHDDPTTSGWLQQILQNVAEGPLGVLRRTGGH